MTNNVPVPSVILQNPGSLSSNKKNLGLESYENPSRSLTDQQLKTKAFTVARKMREFERAMEKAAALNSSSLPIDFTAPAQTSKEPNGVYADYLSVYNNTLLPDALALRAELWRRVGAVTPDSDMTAFDKLNPEAYDAHPDRYPIRDGAAYLENLAKHLPNSR